MSSSDSTTTYPSGAPPSSGSFSFGESAESCRCVATCAEHEQLVGVPADGKHASVESGEKRLGEHGVESGKKRLCIAFDLNKTLVDGPFPKEEIPRGGIKGARCAELKKPDAEICVRKADEKEGWLFVWRRPHAKELVESVFHHQTQGHCRLAFYTAWPSQWGKEVIERLLLPGVQLRPCSESTLAAEEMEEVSNHVLLFDTPRGRPVTRERLTRRSGEVM
mmetsp:Transcript_7844/g.18283  ORF Transcript_7844/g.18283 Transcript_7844/m.18283 type:complete len:221 (-) Transcript_7844:482-1144(-)